MTHRDNKTLDQFDFDRLPKLNRALVHDLATNRYFSEHAPVLIVGQVGVGKVISPRPSAIAPSVAASMFCSPAVPN